jgi:hypothetical protein
MSSVKSSSAKQAARQYVSTVPFHNDLFSYATSYNASTGITSGAISAPIAGANASTCPAGRILRENGKKLYVGAHPGVPTYMVGVFDSASMLSGYIDPNSPVFAVSNNQIPGFYANGVDPGVGGMVDAGQPVYTNGVVVAKGQIRNVGPAGERVALNGAQANIAIDARTGPFIFISGNGNNTLTVNNFNFGDRLYIQMSGTGNVTFSTGFGVSTNNVTKNSMMFTFVCDGAHMLEQSRANWALVY